MKITELNIGQRALVRDHLSSADYAKELTVREFSPSRDHARVEYQNGSEAWIPVQKYVVIELLPPKAIMVDDHSRPLHERFADVKVLGLDQGDLITPPSNGEKLVHDLLHHNTAFIKGYNDALEHCRTPAEKRTATGFNPYVEWIEKENYQEWTQGFEKGCQDFRSRSATLSTETTHVFREGYAVGREYAEVKRQRLAAGHGGVPGSWYANPFHDVEARMQWDQGFEKGIQDWESDMQQAEEAAS